MMGAVVKRAIRDEKGAALALALVLLVVGALILTPLLGLMSTGLLAGQVYERKTDELYAADAGVEDAIWRIQTDSLTFDGNNCSESWQLTVNDRSVEVKVCREDMDLTPCGVNFTYQILSTVISDGEGGVASINGTTIDAYLAVSHTSMNFSALLDYAIVSNNTITLMPGTEVDGDVWLQDEEGLNKKGEINGQVKDTGDVELIWPTAQQLRDYYLGDVIGAPDPGPSIDINHTQTIGPCHRDGSLTVDNTGGSAALVLEGTVYVDGNLDFEQPGGHEYTIDLHGQTIFVEGHITFPSNHVNISGSGCIIAVGYVNFQPGITGDEDDFVLVMSITDEVNFQPGGDFTGCVAGNTHVQVQPNGDFEWTSPDGKNLNFPMGGPDLDHLPPPTGFRIESWEIE